MHLYFESIVVGAQPKCSVPTHTNSRAIKKARMEELQVVNLFNPSRILGSRYVIIVIDKGLDLDLTCFFRVSWVWGWGDQGISQLP